jgi:hypothetical protein
VTRIAFLHTGAVVIPTFSALAAEHLPGVEVQNLLDDKIVADLGRGAAAEQVAQRLADLGGAAVAAGAEAVMFTCSSISQYAVRLPIVLAFRCIASTRQWRTRPFVLVTA